MPDSFRFAVSPQFQFTFALCVPSLYTSSRAFRNFYDAHCELSTFPVPVDGVRSLVCRQYGIASSPRSSGI
jgi:hypothetical protein